MNVKSYTGVNGRAVHIDMDRAEAVMDEDGETHIFTSSDWYRVREDHRAVVRDWTGEEAR